MIVVSYATPPYFDGARKLADSCEKHGIDYVIEMRPSAGSWELNVNGKPGYMLDQMMRFDRPVIWIDSDAVIRQPFPEIEPCDVAFHRFRGHQVCSGTVYVNNTPGGMSLLQQWQDRCHQKPGSWDQVSLQVVSEGGVAVIRDLGPEWCYIFDLSRKFYPGVDPVVEHFQKSREVRG